MQDWKEFNELKNEGWKTKTQDEYTSWQGKVKEWYKNQTELTDWDKDQIKVQLQKINENKEEYFRKKQKQYQPKQNYIFREGAESEAFIRLCNTISQFLEMKMSLSELG